MLPVEVNFYIKVYTPLYEGTVAHRKQYKVTNDVSLAQMADRHNGLPCTLMFSETVSSR